MQKVVNDYRLKNVELEVALRASESDGGGGAVNLHADHGHSFALRRIHFARHDGRTRFVLRDR